MRWQFCRTATDQSHSPPTRWNYEKLHTQPDSGRRMPGLWSPVHGDEPTTGSRGATGGAWTCESRIHPGALICSVPQPGIRGGREHSKLTSRATLDFNGEAHNERKAVSSSLHVNLTCRQHANFVTRRRT